MPAATPMPNLARSPCAILLWTTLLAYLSCSFKAVRAAVSVSDSIADQYPQVAHVGEAFSWALSSSTFTSSVDGATISYTVTGLPDWCSFDSSTLTFSGTPSDSDVDDDDDDSTTAVTVSADDGHSAATDVLELFVTSQPAPTLRKSLVQQLPVASSLGRSQILEGTMLHIPWGWSFSVGWSGDTFTLPGDRLVYTMGTINGFETLPSWLKYSNSTYAMWGIAPTSPPSEGIQFTFSLTGSNAPGYSGVTSNITIVLGDGDMSIVSGGFPTLNLTSGATVNYTLPYGDILIDDIAIHSASWVNVTADTSAQTWLTFDSDTLTFEGTAPDEDSETTSTVPLTITNAVGTTVDANMTIAIYPQVFSSSSLPDVYVEAGQEFNVSFSEYVRSDGSLNISATFDPSNASDWATWSYGALTLAGTAPDSLDYKVLVTLTDEGEASTGDSSSLDRRASTSSEGSRAAFYISLNGTDAGSAGGSSGGSDSSGNHGLSASAKRALIAVFVILGLLLLLLLILYLARRRKRSRRNADAVENRVSDSRGRSPAMSEKTLNNPSPAFGGASPAFGDAFFSSKKYKVGQSPLPSPVPRAHSPYLDPASADGRGILIGGRHYGGPSPEMMDTVWGRRTPGEEDSLTPADADRPRQHGFMSAFVTGAKKKFPSSKNLSNTQDAGSTSAVAPARGNHSRSESVGLGFMGVEGLEAPEQETRPSQQSVGNHTRSRHSLGSSVSKESWEEDLFYGPGEIEQRTMLNPIIEVDEVPRRRGSQRLSARPEDVPMRQRISHHNASPAFNAPGTFAADGSGGYARPHSQAGPFDGDQLTATQSTSYSGSQDELPAGASGEYVIGTAQRVDVRDMNTGSVTVRTPDLRENHHLSGSSYLQAFVSTGESGIFDDAEVEPDLPQTVVTSADEPEAIYEQEPQPEVQAQTYGQTQAQHLRPSLANERWRDSAIARVSADPALMAMSPYLLYAEQDQPGYSASRPTSPRPPSLFGAASINSTTRPEDTLRSVPAQSSAGRRSMEMRSETPPPTSTQMLMNNPYAKIAPQGPAGPPRYSRSGAPTGRSAYRKIEHIEAHVTTGERIRIKLTPAGGAAMVGGAPGSPGKRSSRAGKYVPVLDDESMQAHRTWPLWLSEWLHWDNLMFELSGEVPIDFELEQVNIALVHRKPKETVSTTGNPNTAPVPGSPGKEEGRSIIDVNGIIMVDEVVAKLTLWIAPGAVDPYAAHNQMMMRAGSAF